MTRILWGRSARQDVYRIAGYYRQFDPELPDILLDRIAQAPLPLIDNPRLGSPTDRPGIRKWLVRKTPFVLLYAIVRADIQLRRVIHAQTDRE